MNEKYKLFVEKLKEEGFLESGHWNDVHNKLNEFYSYKYAGDDEFLRYPPEEARVIISIYKNTKITAELIVQAEYYYKTSSLEDLIAEIEKVKKTKDLSDFSKLEY